MDKNKKIILIAEELESEHIARIKQQLGEDVVIVYNPADFKEEIKNQADITIPEPAKIINPYILEHRQPELSGRQKRRQRREEERKKRF